MDATRKATLAAGVFYLLTFISIPALILVSPVLNDPHYIVGAGDDPRVLLGCLFDMVTALACIGTAVALFPVLRRHNESLALGFITARVFEAGVILIGVVSLLAVVTLRQDANSSAGADAATLVVAGRTLVAVRDWTFLLGPGIVPAINALLLGSILYRSRLVPRVLPLVGLIGAPLLLVSSLAAVFGATEQTSALSVLLVLPIASWELGLGVWMIVRGFHRAGGPAGAGHSALPAT